MIIGPLTEYIGGALSQALPAATVRKTQHHILDSLASMISGSRMAAGEAGKRFVERNPATGPCTVVGLASTTSANQAALANAMSAHADETDDSHAPSLTHPGCAVIPAALAVAEREGRSGRDFLRAVTLGYDIDGRITRALWPDYTVLRTKIHSTHAFGSLWGASAAAAALGGLDPDGIRFHLSYTAQQTAGVKSWLRDVEHVEKAYAFAALGASNGARALDFVQAGWPGVRDVFSGVPNFFDAFGDGCDPSLLVEGLGSRFVIDETNIKRFTVGSPAQAPLQGLVDMMRDEGLDGSRVASVTVTMPGPMAEVVMGRDMPDINMPYLLTCALEDGDVSFAAAHDEDRFHRWKDRGGDARITIVKSDTMEYIRQAIVDVRMEDGTEHRRHETAVRGTPGNPMSTEEVEAKARDLCAPVMGEEATERMIALCRGLESVEDIGVLSAVLASAA